MKPIVVTAIYRTNAWHYRSSRELIGLATTEESKEKMIKRFLRENKVSTASRNVALQHIDEFGQTQCLNENYDFEIDTEVYTLDQYLG